MTWIQKWQNQGPKMSKKFPWCQYSKMLERKSNFLKSKKPIEISLPFRFLGNNIVFDIFVLCWFLISESLVHRQNCKTQRSKKYDDFCQFQTLNSITHKNPYNIKVKMRKRLKYWIYRFNFMLENKSSWRNRLARSTVNREVVGSIPTEDALFKMLWY